MSYFLFAVDRVLPLFIMVVVGSFLRRWGWINDRILPSLNKICFYLLLPCMVLNSALDSDLSSIQSPLMYIYAGAAYILFLVPLVLAGRRFIKDPKRAGAFVHASFRANTVLIGLPLIISVVGNDRALPAVLLIVLLNPFDNVFGILSLQVFSRGQERHLGRELLEVVKNPMVVAAFLGIGCMFLPVELPRFLTYTISSFGGASLPVSMLIIGARFRLHTLREDAPLVLLASFLKLIVMPLFFFTGGYLLGVRGLELFALWAVTAMPTAAVSSVITGLMGCDGHLGDEMTIVSTALCPLTLIAGISLFAAAGVI
ncbi:MAG: AEC family transporter [Firmicutes bacterium]|nr:AEC family transporter [Bacillota bacterium]